MQEPLLHLQNPLDRLLGGDFFKSLPTEPGVYRMYDDQGELLYVGKAKNLRTRLASYRRIKINEKSRKSLRLVHQIARIEYESCLNEEAALIRENQLLREEKPPFNVVNTTPETYFFFTVKFLESNEASVEAEISSPQPTLFSLNLPPVKTQAHSIELALTLKMEDPSLAVFGAFKGLASGHRAFFALRRMLWLVDESNQKISNFEFPLNLFKRQRLRPYRFAAHPAWINRLAGFFHGFSHAPLQKEPELILELKRFANQLQCETFYQEWIQADIETLLKFYRSGPARNSRLKPFSETDSANIEQNRLDDLVVKNHFARKLG